MCKDQKMVLLTCFVPEKAWQRHLWAVFWRFLLPLRRTMVRSGRQMLRWFRWTLGVLRRWQKSSFEWSCELGTKLRNSGETGRVHEGFEIHFLDQKYNRRVQISRRRWNRRQGENYASRISPALKFVQQLRFSDNHRIYDDNLASQNECVSGPG